MDSFGYKVLKNTDGNPILCEEITFSDLQSFLYFDFWKGIKNKYIPNCCKLCGKFFLIKGGKYFNYCNRPLKTSRIKIVAMSAADAGMTTSAKMILYGRHTTVLIKRTMHDI